MRVSPFDGITPGGRLEGFCVFDFLERSAQKAAAEAAAVDAAARMLETGALATHHHFAADAEVAVVEPGGNADGGLTEEAPPAALPPLAFLESLPELPLAAAGAAVRYEPRVGLLATDFLSDFSFFYLLTTPSSNCFPLTALLVVKVDLGEVSFGGHVHDPADEHEHKDKATRAAEEAAARALAGTTTRVPTELLPLREWLPCYRHDDVELYCDAHAAKLAGGGDDDDRKVSTLGRAHPRPVALERAALEAEAGVWVRRDHVWWLLADDGADASYKPYHRRAAALGHICHTVRHELTAADEYPGYDGVIARAGVLQPHLFACRDRVIDELDAVVTETLDAELESKAAPEDETSTERAERWRRRDLRHRAFESKGEFVNALMAQPAARGAMGYLNYVLTQV